MRVEAKAAIARQAAKLVEPGMSIMLDDSTTALSLAKLLPEFVPLTVATNYLRGIELLKDVDDLRLICLGGDYSRTHNSFLGMPCLEAVEEHHGRHGLPVHLGHERGHVVSTRSPRSCW